MSYFARKYVFIFFLFSVFSVSCPAAVDLSLEGGGMFLPDNTSGYYAGAMLGMPFSEHFSWAVKSGYFGFGEKT